MNFRNLIFMRARNMGKSTLKKLEVGDLCAMPDGSSWFWNGSKFMRVPCTVITYIVTNENPESRTYWRNFYAQMQAAGIKFQRKSCGEWVHPINMFDFSGKKEDYREVPLEQPAIGVISSFNKWDRALTEKEISDLFSGKVRPEDIPQEVQKEGDMRIPEASREVLKQWQPIETAPKNGTEIDLWVHGERIADCKLLNGKWMFYGIDSFNSPGYVAVQGEPTHWQPLPAVPKAEVNQ